MDRQTNITATVQRFILTNTLHAKNETKSTVINMSESWQDRPVGVSQCVERVLTAVETGRYHRNLDTVHYHFIIMMTCNDIFRQWWDVRTFNISKY